MVYDVVIIGSGYGGSAVAARVAPFGKTLLLERGRRWRPGEFPESLTELARTYHSRRNPLGLWAMRMAEGTGNAYVSGVGGASLVNYGITAMPQSHVLAAWPWSTKQLSEAYERALDVLQPEASPLANELEDKHFLDRVEPGRRVDLKCTIDWRGCTHCGKCVPGCNVGAKRSLDRTYQPIALAGGAEIRPRHEVVDLRREGDLWHVTARSATSASSTHIPARNVVISAGTFGTLDLLHRLADRIPLSRWFGRAMSMNGDGLAFLYNTRHPLSGEHGAPITTTVQLPFFDPDGRERVLTVMAGRIPKLVMHMSAVALALLADIVGRGEGPQEDPRIRRVRRLMDLTSVGRDGALAHTLMYKLDAEDSGRGYAVFDAKGRAALQWPDYRDDPIMKFAARRLEDWAERIGGVLIPDLAGLPGMRSFGVHPLGGCRAGATVDEGVVDTAGRVFRPDGGVYPGLYIADASILPSSLGVPSSLTVAALGEVIGEHLARRLDSST